jgi:hypothetical protein
MCLPPRIRLVKYAQTRRASQADLCISQCKCTVRFFCESGGDWIHRDLCVLTSMIHTYRRLARAHA